MLNVRNRNSKPQFRNAYSKYVPAGKRVTDRRPLRGYADKNRIESDALSVLQWTVRQTVFLAFSRNHTSQVCSYYRTTEALRT